jgi:hypothetical protein
MKNWSKINSENIVVECLVFEDGVVPLISLPTGWRWIQNDKAFIGATYDEEKNDIITIKPFPSWSLNENNEWVSPIPTPSDGQKYVWNEEIVNWEIVT